jgi:hypothetical protein
MSLAITPGPWEIDANDFGDITRRFIWNAEFAPGHQDCPTRDTDYCIATVQPRGSVEVLEANARLIAAAPQLLEALTEMREAFGNEPDACGECDSGSGATGRDVDGNPCQCCDPLRRALAAADAAIAKVEGRS